MTTELTNLNLTQRVAFANQLAGQINEALDRAWKTAVVLGWELTRLKAELPHGEFGKLFENDSKSEQRFAFGERAAQKYMRLYTLCCEKAGQLAGGGAASAAWGDTPGAELPRSADTRRGVCPQPAECGQTPGRLSAYPRAGGAQHAPGDVHLHGRGGGGKKTAGAPLPHMRQQTARPAHTRHLAEMVQPGKPEVSRRDLTLAEWTTLLSTVETFIRDVARHLTNSDRDFCADQLRELATALQHAKGNLITTQE